jgi:hypothetical protein
MGNPGLVEVPSLRSVFGLLSFTLLAACSDMASPVATQPLASSPAGSRVLPTGNELVPFRDLHLHPAGLGNHVRHLFLSDAVFNTVTVFGSGGKTSTLSGFNEPQGITADRFSTLYVANTIDQNVEEFAPPFPNMPRGTISTPGQWPVDVAVAPNGMVAAINICQAAGSQCGGPGSVYFFSNNRAKSPCAQVSGSTQISRLLWGGFDSNATLYVAGVSNYTTVEVGAIHGGCNAKSLKLLKPSVAINFPSGVQVDPMGRVAILDSNGFSGAPSIDVFAPPKRGSTMLKLLTQSTLNDSGVVVSFALNKGATTMFTAEPHYSLEYPYPGGGTAIGQFTPPPSGGDLIEGVAVTPAELP